MNEPRALTAFPLGELVRLAVVVNAGLALSLAFIWVQQARQGDLWKGDFSSYYFGGAIIRDGHGGRLYERELQRAYQGHIVPERGDTDELLGFNYPPHSGLPAPLFAMLPREAAFYLYTLAQLLLLIPVFYFVRRLTDDPRRVPWLVAATAVLAYPPLYISFQLGQVSILLLVCLLGFACNLAGGRPIWTALWLTLGTIKPQMMVAPFALLIAGRRWRELAYTALLLVLWGTATTAMLGTSCWMAFLRMLQHSATQFGRDGITPLAMYNCKGFLTCILGGESTTTINLLSVSLLLVAVLLIVAKGRKPMDFRSAEWDLRMAFALQLGLLSNPHLNPSDAASFMAPALLYYRGLRRLGHPARGVAWLLLCAPSLFALDCYGLSVARPGAIHPFFVLMAILAAIMATHSNCVRRLRCPD